jgi:hypothetical protein
MTDQKYKTWIKRLGVIGFLFFLAKGLAWLTAAGLTVLWLR